MSKIVQGPPPVLHKTGERVIGYFKKDSVWVSAPGDIEYLLYKEWEPVYNGMFECEVLDCAKLVGRKVVIPIKEATVEEFWAAWNLDTFWKWIEKKYPEYLANKEEIEEKIKRLTTYNGIAIQDGLMNLFAACRDRVAFEDALSQEDADELWKEFNSILARTTKMSDVQKYWRYNFGVVTWNKNFRHFVSYISRKLMRAVCSQREDGCEFILTVLNYLTYTPQHELSKDNFCLYLDLDTTPHQFSSPTELKSINCRAYFADGSFVECTLHDAVVENAQRCANYTLIPSYVDKQLTLHLLREIAGSYYNYLYKRGDLLAFKYGNCYLQHPSREKHRQKKEMQKVDG